MGRQKAFMEVPRLEAGYRPLHDRVKDFSEVEQTLNSSQRREQAARCMDCGVPFCHWACPLGNKQPEWNTALANGDWALAYALLSATNDFPEFTGRVCPALCEKACVLHLTRHEAVTNRENEAAITEMAWREGFLTAQSYARNGGRVAVVGAGPAGLVAANRLNRLGYAVAVYDRQEAAGGLLRYGIPNFKLNKAIVERRVSLLAQEGIRFVFGADIDLSALAATGSLPAEYGVYDAVVVATGTPQPRDLPIAGRTLRGVHFALELLSQQNRRLAGLSFAADDIITAKGKDVLVIGGGDTGSDCIGTAIRQGARSVTQIEIMPPPLDAIDDPQHPWPYFPKTLKTTSSHEEGCQRRWNTNTLAFVGEGGSLRGARVQRVVWQAAANGEGRPTMTATGDEETIKCELALLAMGFLRPVLPSFPSNVFVAGDALNGPSLVVHAMASGREAALAVDRYLRAATNPTR